MWGWEGCDTVRCGFWVNWSSDANHGSTLTLPSQWAMVMIAFLALFVKLIGGYLWEVVCFVVHQMNASFRAKDDLHHQIQVVLRNTESESSFVWKLFKVSHAHKGTRSEAYRRSSWLIVLAVFHGLSMWAAGGLSSRFIAGSDEVQALPGRCGWMKEVSMNDLSDNAKFEAANALLVMARVGYRRIASYSKSCYAATTGNTTSSSCEPFIRPTLPYNVSVTDPCPFDAKICNGLAITLDTGPLRSDTHLGINTRPEDAMSFRKTLSCVPLAGENYTDGWLPAPSNTSLGKMGALVKGYKFSAPNTLASGSNYTFATSDIWFEIGDQPYNVEAVSAFVNYKGDQAILFDPIPELQSPEADVNVVSMMNRIGYRSAVDDPWFSAQNCTTCSECLSPDRCAATNPLSFLGCQERYQFCTSHGSNCSPLTGLHGIDPDPQKSPDLNPTQQALFQLLWKITWFAQLNFQLIFIGAENLQANDYLWDGGSGTFSYSAALPSDQWQREVKNWMNTSLAAMQRASYAFARPPEFDVGPGIPVLEYVVEPEDPTMQLLCHKIKARSKIHTSFSVLGLFLTIALGLLIIALNLSLPTLVGYFQRRSGTGLHKRLEWIESSIFQLLRMAAEGRGVGPWNGRERDVPTLAERGHLFNLTGSAARGVHSRAGSYEVVGKGQTGVGEFELAGLTGLKDAAIVRQRQVHDDRTRLLGE